MGRDRLRALTRAARAVFWSAVAGGLFGVLVLGALDATEDTDPLSHGEIGASDYVGMFLVGTLVGVLFLAVVAARVYSPPPPPPPPHAPLFDPTPHPRRHGRRERS